MKKILGVMVTMFFFDLLALLSYLGLSLAVRSYSMRK